MGPVERWLGRIPKRVGAGDRGKRFAQRIAFAFEPVRSTGAGRSVTMTDMRAICETLGFDPTNHHNAVKCPYCRPAAATDPVPENDELEALLDEWAQAAGHFWYHWGRARGDETSRPVSREDLRQLVRVAADRAAKFERHACSISVWMTMQDAQAPGADDKGLDGWMREAEYRVKARA